MLVKVGFTSPAALIEGQLKSYRYTNTVRGRW